MLHSLAKYQDSSSFFLFFLRLTDTGIYGTLSASKQELYKGHSRGFLLHTSVFDVSFTVCLHCIMQEGTIARLTDKGYGFITPADGSKDIFFHANALVDVMYNDLREGDKVTFEVGEGPKGPNATNVTRVA